MRFRERNQIVTAFSPVDVNGSATTGDYVSLKAYNHCTVIIQCGVMGATCNITMLKATAVAATGATTYPFDAYAYKADSAGTWTGATGASGTIATGTTNNRIFCIELDASEIRSGGTTNYDCVNVNISNPGSSAIMSGLYILSEPRYAQEEIPTAIAD